MDNQKELKGKKAEERFKQWLDQNNIPYWYIQQDLSTFSPSLKKYFLGRRPDFMILLQLIGFILVDVEYKKVSTKHNDFTLDCNETIEYSNVQRNFGLTIWYALSNEESDFSTWYWITVTEVLEKGKNRRFTSHMSNQDYFALRTNEFIQISHSDSIDRLFTKLFTTRQQR